MIVPYLTLMRLSRKVSLVNDIACGHKYFKHNIIVHRNSSVVRPVPVDMAFTFYGEGERLVDSVPIIIMHGLFGSKTNWNSLGKLIMQETKKRVYVVDSRNHGDSPHTNEHTYPHLAEDIKHFMATHEIKKAAVMGHSMGGRAMMALALQYPEKLESLIVVDISPISSPQAMTDMIGIFKVMETVVPVVSKSLSEARRIVEKKLESVLGSKELSSFLSMNLADHDGKFAWKINLATITKSYDPHILRFPFKTGKFRGPTLFVCGQKSDFVNFKEIHEILMLFPKASFVKVENAGHWVHAEQPKTFQEVVCKFINSTKT